MDEDDPISARLKEFRRLNDTPQQKICEALGLDPYKVTYIQMNISPHSIRVTVDLDDIDNGKLVSSFSHFKLVKDDDDGSIRADT
jgi:hypothetical protein